MSALGDAIFIEHHRKSAEAVGLDDVHAHVEEGAVKLLDHVGPRDVEDLVAPFEVVAPEIVDREVLHLKTRAGGPVVDQHAFAEGREIGIVGPRSGEGRANSQFHCCYRLPVGGSMSLR